MNRIQKTFHNNNKAFVAYLTAGQKGLEYSLQSSLAIIEAGADILEIGIPFSDPIADGPVIQKAMEDALERKTTPEDVFSLVSKIREINHEIPIVLFSYLNPIIKKSDEFFKEAANAGADALLIVDMPLEESKNIHEKCFKNGLELIFIISPSTPKKRISKITKQAGGFLYYVCRKGTTGMKSELPEGFENKVREIKSISKLPVIAGFGISTREMAEQVTTVADGFVVGSYFVNAMGNSISQKDLTESAKSIKPCSYIYSVSGN
ncbi:MAG TPA: tryptophan synthase subunit alpha [Lentisphaeria bacterium]|nr:MAG: tryptophan synthase subunit alpha [Lentisphaerae bacterium GWF2_38_69]HBM15581.1 tryptophan synthase subunit alpha [Lentisphaeria bacterium]